MRGRPTVTSYVYDDQGRVSRTVTASAWSEEDRALMLGYRQYRDSLCPGGCGQPKALAHHWDQDGWYEAHSTTCHACTARAQAENTGSEPTKPVDLTWVEDVRDYEKKPLPETKPVKRGGRR